jgi:Zn-dependent protease
MLNLIIKSGSWSEAIATALAVISAALVAIMFHECAHAYAALKCGDMTAKLSGRLTLNPAKHFDLVGMLMFLVAGFGWAKPVPINPDNFRNKKVGILIVSLAGVATNLLLAFLSFGLLNLVQLMFSGVTRWTAFASFLRLFLFYFFMFATIVNVTLAAFNILPLYPLDGYRVVEALAPRSAYCRFMRRYGAYILLGLVFVSFFLGRFFWFLDIFGMYIRWVQTGVFSLLEKIWGAIL